MTLLLCVDKKCSAGKAGKNAGWLPAQSGSRPSSPVGGLLQVDGQSSCSPTDIHSNMR